MDLDLGTGFKYHDYLLLIAGLDAEWTRHFAYSEPAKSPDFATWWKNLYFEPFKEIKTYCEQQKKYLKSPSNNSRSKERYENLYTPHNFIPLGDCDALSFILIDDFEPEQDISSQCSKTLEEVNLAFCPIFQSEPYLKQYNDKQVIDDKDLWLANIFVSPEKLFEKEKSNKVMLMCKFKYSSCNAVKPLNTLWRN